MPGVIDVVRSTFANASLRHAPQEGGAPRPSEDPPGGFAIDEKNGRWSYDGTPCLRLSDLLNTRERFALPYQTYSNDDSVRTFDVYIIEDMTSSVTGMMYFMNLRGEIIDQRPNPQDNDEYDQTIRDIMDQRKEDIGSMLQIHFVDMEAFKQLINDESIRIRYVNGPPPKDT